MKNQRMTNLVAVAALAAAIFAIARADAGRFRPLDPAVVATVDIERVFREITAGLEADAELQSLAADLEGQAQRRRDEIQLLREDLGLYVPGSSEYSEIEQNIARKTYEFRAYQEFKDRSIDAAMSRTLLSLYQSIRDEIAVISGEFGFDIVFVDDSVVPLPRGGTEQEMMRQISARRMLHTSDRIDITDIVLARMNG